MFTNHITLVYFDNKVYLKNLSVPANKGYLNLIVSLYSISGKMTTQSSDDILLEHHLVSVKLFLILMF